MNRFSSLIFAVAGSLLFWGIFLPDDTGAFTLTVQILEDRSLTSTTTGQAILDSGLTEISLSNSAFLDLSNSIALASSGLITIGGQEKNLSNFVSGDLSGIDMTAAKNIGGASVIMEKAIRLMSGIEGQPLMIKNADLSSSSFTLPYLATVLAPNGWDGKIVPPKTGSSAGTAPSGFSIGGTVIEVGSSDVVLLFDKPAEVILTGVTGNVGYKPAGVSSWTRITSTCGGTYALPASPTFPGECSISNGSDTKISTYHFTTFAELTAVPEEAQTTETVSSGGGGGGGGGGGVAPYIPLQSGTENITFKGRAYPGANITILKDGSVLKTLTADIQGNYTASASMSSGLYTFSIYAVDNKNNRSLTTSFTTSVSALQPKTISDIVVSPTISADKSTVKFGNDVQFFGYAYPQSQINVIINSEHEIYATTSADNFGSWLYKINSGVLAIGDHTTRSQSITLDGMISPFSESLAFKVGDKDVAFGILPKTSLPATRAINGDINGDNKTNIIDFSIMLFFWNQKNPSNPAADLNGDGEVNLFDFSIMLFWWTG